MNTHYEVIRADNLRKYGEDVGRYGEVLLRGLYKERTHFIFELLQNAEDAHASSIAFSLKSDRLEVTHDGRPFNETDVRGICGLVEGTKSDDELTIGKFGIGFKSVYAYTRTPEIHSGPEHFYVENYVRPFPAAPVEIPQTQTLFVFPFDHPELAPKESFQEIRKRLENLGPEVLLFLTNVQEIRWVVTGGTRGSYRRTTTERSNVTYRSLMTDRPTGSQGHMWATFSKPVENHPSLNVQIAYRLEAGGTSGRTRVSPLTESPLHAFLPTDKETNLGFLINGPYQTTPARDNITDASFNRRLIQETAGLIGESLLVMRDAGYMDTQMLKALPTRPEQFGSGTDFHPIFTAVRDCLRTQKVLPALGGDHTDVANAKLAREVAVRELLDHEALRDLFATSENLRWLSGEITVDRTPELRSYFMRELNIEEMDGASFARKVSGRFLARRSDEWMVRLYKFLERRDAMWRPGGPLRDKPIIRLETGSHLPPFRPDRAPSAYLPPRHETMMPIVKRTIASDPDVKKFLSNLGYVEPDLIAEVFEQVLPKYEEGSKPAPEEHLQDLRKIHEALESRGPHGDRLLEKVRTLACVIARNAKTNNVSWQIPGNAYFATQELQLYFEGNAQAWLVDRIYSEELVPALRSLGVGRTPRVRTRSPNGFGNVVLASEFGDHKRGRAGFDPQASVDGLRHAVTNPTPDKSAFVWNEILRVRPRLILGTVEESTRQDFTGSKSEEMPSKFGRIVRQVAWLPAPTGDFVQPATLAMDELPDEFIPDEEVAARLGMKASSLKALAEEAQVNYDLLRSIAQHEDAFLQLAEELRRQEETSLGEQVSELNYASELQDRFSQPSGVSAEPEDFLASLGGGSLPDPERRREKVRGEISADREREPRLEHRFSLVESKSWEGKNKNVRAFLVNEYAGLCQICSASFKKRNGQPHFEGVYLIPYTQAKWVDRGGNVLCLCPTCAAKMMYGPLEADDITEQIRGAQLGGGDGTAPQLRITLCGEPTYISFTERHMLDLQELVSTGGPPKTSDSTNI